MTAMPAVAAAKRIAPPAVAAASDKQKNRFFGNNVNKTREQSYDCSLVFVHLLYLSGRESGFRRAAEGADKIGRQVFKLRAGGHIVVGIAQSLIVLPAAQITDIFVHRGILLWFCFGCT
jgi:hypothetical protein